MRAEKKKRKRKMMIMRMSIGRMPQGRREQGPKASVVLQRRKVHSEKKAAPR